MSETRHFHALERTSPRGGSFLGRCIRCGREDLPPEAVFRPCDNTAEMTDDEALVACVRGEAR